MRWWLELSYVWQELLISKLYFYEIALIKSPLPLLTYSSKKKLSQGTLVTVPLQNRSVEGVVLSNKTDKSSFDILEIIDSSDYSFSHDQMKFAHFISKYYFSSEGDALALFVPFSINIPLTYQCEIVKNIQLSSQQNNAFEFIKKHPISLLFGDTGSGKTEIYMKYFEQMIIERKRSLFLMPEISLTPQMQIRLETHFGSSVVMWHSKLTKKQKEKSLERIYDGSATIIAGARSALFLPVKDLGLIVVDEEHDDSYKASSRPRYHARDMAIYMGSVQNIPVILGSATPSLTSYVKFPFFRLKGGYFSSVRTFLFEAHKEEITYSVEREIIDTIEKDQQAILFIPTRANFKYLICDTCGHRLTCPYCSVGMSVHRYAKSVKCHYCGYTERIPQQCPQCHQGTLISTRLGTAEAVEYFKTAHPTFSTEQFDRDSVSTHKKLKTLLKRFNNHEVDLLVGTQMLSKGHDYHDVTLAVILGLDNILNLSDYRARERALSLLIQIAGRSGRKKEAKVLVQSFNQEFFEPYVNDYQSFLDDEKFFREGMYPPYKKLARVLFAHKNGQKAQEAMNEMVQKLQLFNMINVVGFGPSPIEKIANKYRFQILLRADKSTDLIRAIKASKNTLAEIDMDPIEFG